MIAGLVAAFAIIGAGLIGSAQAQDCPRGELDKAYCDRDGDMVADVPTDPKQLVNPSTLIFAYTPVEDPAVYAKAWDGFVKYMAETTGKKVVFFPVQSNAAEIEAMRSGRLHVAGFNTGSNPIAVNCSASCRSPSWARRTASSAMKWKSSCRPTARSKLRPI